MPKQVQHDGAGMGRIATPSPRAHPRCVKRAFLLVAALAALAPPGLGGCSGGPCLPPPDWPAKLDFAPRFPDRDEKFERFSINAAGTILWTGFPGRPTPISLAELRRILTTVGDPELRPWLVLDAPPGADCDTVRAVRAEMDKLPLCRSGRCVEGKVWDRSDPPRGFSAYVPGTLPALKTLKAAE
jgi:hypothetical protein